MADLYAKIIGTASNYLYSYVLIILLVGGGIYFTIRTKGVQLRYLLESIRVILEPSDKEDESISAFQALMVSTASRVGTGNIAGISTAICFGGPGAIFWMWVTALLGGATAFIESTLAQIYKKRAPDGSCYGGPAYYMRDALGKRWMGVIFSVLIILIYAVGYNMLAAYNLQSTFSVFKFYHPVITPAFIGVILALMGTACLIQLANIQLINGKTMAQAAAQSRTITVTLKARRGKIMDTNGSILAQSVERYTIIGNPEEAQAFTPTTCTKQTGDNCHQIDGKPVGATGAAAVARLLAPVLDMDATELGAMLSGTGQYAVLKK